MNGPETESRTHRSSVLAGVLSALVPGLGQIYAGSWRRGLTLLLGLPVQAALFYGVGLIWLIYWMVAVWIWNVFDAAMTARGRATSALGPILLILALNMIVACKVTDIQVPKLGPVQRTVIGEIAGGMAKPDLLTPRPAPAHGFTFSQATRTAAPKMLETVYLALLGTIISLIFAIPLSFFGARNLMSRSAPLKLIYGLTRAIFSVLRSVEVLIFAVIAVAAVGVGPFAGVIALSIHGIGAMGKLYSEAIESIEHGPIEAIRATGANEFQVVLYGVVPQVVPQFIAFTLYRWDINVRMATVIGLVGGGGIGAELIQYMGLLQWQQAATCIWMIAGVVMLMDYASAVIREKVV
jgi:phosphonate ABC transporter permease subunit PhnE